MRTTHKTGLRFPLHPTWLVMPGTVPVCHSFSRFALAYNQLYLYINMCVIGPTDTVKVNQ